MTGESACFSGSVPSHCAIVCLYVCARSCTCVYCCHHRCIPSCHSTLLSRSFFLLPTWCCFLDYSADRRLGYTQPSPLCSSAVLLSAPETSQQHHAGRRGLMPSGVLLARLPANCLHWITGILTRGFGSKSEKTPS